MSFIGLPDSTETSEHYLAEHFRCLSEFLDRQQLTLSYDRTSFDTAILSSLRRCCIYLHEHRKPEIGFYGLDEVASEHEKRYIGALQVIFNKFNELVDVSVEKPFDRAKAIVASIGKCLEEISLCVVQTGNADDAYTLFEVLNDRSLALDDLDLIKNQFYKNFVLKNSVLSEDEVDRTLQILDDQWVDKIFGNQGDQKRKLIAYLSIVFITGDESVIYNRGDGCRRAIQAYLKGLDNYSKDQIIKHFNIFESCKVLLDAADVKFKSKDLVSLESEFDSKSSVLKKSVNLLMALNQEGVLSGLVNFVLKYIEKSGGQDSGNQDLYSKFSPGVIKIELEKYMGSGLPVKVTEQSRRVWQISIFSNTAEIPRGFSVELIKHNNLKSDTWDLRESGDREKAKNDFIEWMSNWRYSSSHLKVRLLFARLISLTPGKDGELVRKPLALGVEEVSKLQLDHIEANKPDSSHSEKYFDDEEREGFIQGLGNMMPLPAPVNVQKSNKPMSESFGFYDSAGIGAGHHLYDSAFELFHKYNENGVPEKEFFQMRKEQLKTLFLEAAEFHG